MEDMFYNIPKDAVIRVVKWWCGVGGLENAKRQFGLMLKEG